MGPAFEFRTAEISGGVGSDRGGGAESERTGVGKAETPDDLGEGGEDTFGVAEFELRMSNVAGPMEATPACGDRLSGDTGSGGGAGRSRDGVLLIELAVEGSDDETGGGCNGGITDVGELLPAEP